LKKKVKTPKVAFKNYFFKISAAKYSSKKIGTSRKKQEARMNINVTFSNDALSNVS
jgi:hypothetical protein